MSKTNTPLRWSQVLAEEYQSLHGELPLPEPASTPETEADRLAKLHQVIHAKEHAALCLSGGGIRSATFALGVLQGLASFDWLQHFHYLSTVSGGGYIGSWLSAWIHHHPKGVDGVAQAMKVGNVAASKLEPEPEPVQHVRSYSNYLSPKLGVFSADTWTLLATYLRNLFLNWLVLVPLMLAVVLLPRLCFALVRYDPPHWLTTTIAAWRGSALSGVNWLLVAGAVLAVVAIVFAGLSRPRCANFSQKVILGCCLGPMLGALACFTTYWAWFCHAGVGAFWQPGGGIMTVGGAGVFGLGGVVCAFCLAVRKKVCGKSAQAPSGARVPAEKSGLKACVPHLQSVLKLLAMSVSGAAVGAAAWFLAVQLFPDPLATRAATRMYGCFALPLFTVLVLLAGALLVGLTSRVADDEEREWWGRLGAWLIIVMGAWTLLNVLVEFGPHWLSAGVAAMTDDPDNGLDAVWQWVLGAVGGVSGLFTIFAGKSARTPAGDKTAASAGWKNMLLNKGLVVAATVFGAVATIWLSQLTLALIKGTSHFCRSGAYPCLKELPLVSIVAGWMLLLVVFSVLMSLFININKFSLHALYRARLIRAYLGASRGKCRRPNPFTGFDPEDNFPMSALAQGQGRKPFHVINTALNLVSGRRIAWQQRKAESFTISPLHCGSASLSLEDSDSINFSHGAYRPSADYAKGSGSDSITIGGALTMSGAAASPNMGYHSSRGVAFLLTLFNVRLGAWLGNPGPAGGRTWFSKKPYQLASPRWACGPMLKEAFGLTDDNSPYVYLSDGGHFENLGIYEMVRRRCRFIVVCDGSADPSSDFECLVNAIRKCRTDLGIRITMDVSKLRPNSNTDQDQVHGVLGSIYYSDVDPGAERGQLLYIKASLNGNEPLDVRSYAAENEDFPHQSTGDQFFDEAQFESYRALGLHVVRELFAGTPPVFTSFKGAFDALAKYLPVPGAAMAMATAAGKAAGHTPVT